MKHDDFTLPLFANELLPSSPQFYAPSLPAHWPPAKRHSFTWWCQDGNQEMCAAVLWRTEGFNPADAKALVKALHDQPPVPMTHESPACAHFASPMKPQPQAAA